MMNSQLKSVFTDSDPYFKNNNTELYFKGHSGCDVYIMKRGRGQYRVRKQTSDSQYADRLKRQVFKQKHFSIRNNLNFVAVPKIINEQDNVAGYSFDMDYCIGLDFIDYLQFSDIYAINQLVENLVAIIDQSIQCSRPSTIPPYVISEKCEKTVLKSIENPVCRSNSIHNVIARAAERVCEEKELSIPVGECHGDLTLSNMIFNKTKNKIYVIDFLDSFIETPLCDMVKLRQDTRYCWSYHLREGRFDRQKVKITLDHIDRRLHAHFSKYDFYTSYYRTFQLLNFLRILPYIKNVQTVNYIGSVLRELIKEK